MTQSKKIAIQELNRLIQTVNNSWSKETDDIIAEDTRRYRISLVHTGKALSDFHKEQLSAANKGKKFSEETLKKIQQSRKYYKHSEETRAKISASHLGKPLKLSKEAEELRASRVVEVNSKAVSINGMIYKSMQEAGDALDLGRKTIQRRVTSNKEEFINWKYLDDQHNASKRITVSVPVSIDGVIYDNIHLARLALKIEVNTIRARIKSQTEEFQNWFFVGDSPKKVKESKNKRKPVSINGVVYPNFTVAMEKLNLTEALIKYRIKSLTPRYKEWFYVSSTPKVIQNYKLPNTDRAVIVDGIHYKNSTEAGRAYGISQSSAKQKIESRRSSNKNWNWADAPSKSQSMKQISIEGIIYDDIGEVRRTLGLTYNEIYARIRSTTKHFVNWYYVKNGPKTITKVRASVLKQKAVSIDGVVYESLRAASIILGISKTTVSNRIKNKAVKFKHWYFV